MDLKIYNSILKEAGIDPMAFDKKKKRKYPNGERAFRHDIFENKTIWTNNKLKDYWLFLTSYHVLIGVFAACKHHPYTKRKRIITLSYMLCVGSFWAALSTFFGAKYSDNFLKQNLAKTAVSCANGFVLFLMELSLRFCLQCSCRENTEREYVNNAWKCCTKTVLWCWGCISFAFLIAMICVVAIFDLFSDFLFCFVLQFLFSWLFQCIGLYLKFRKGWKRDKELMDRLPSDDPYHFLFNGRATFTETIREVTFKELLKRRKKVKFPYYVSWFDSNEWIKENEQYLKRDKMKKWAFGKKKESAEILLGTFSGDGERDFVDLSD